MLSGKESLTSNPVTSLAWVLFQGDALLVLCGGKESSTGFSRKDGEEPLPYITEILFLSIKKVKLTKFSLFFRRALRRDESVKYLIQDSVIDYIRENELYGMKCDK